MVAWDWVVFLHTEGLRGEGLVTGYHGDHGNLLAEVCPWVGHLHLSQQQRTSYFTDQGLALQVNGFMATCSVMCIATIFRDPSFNISFDVLFEMSQSQTMQTGVCFMSFFREVDNSQKPGKIPVCRLDFPGWQTCLVNFFSLMYPTVPTCHQHVILPVGNLSYIPDFYGNEPQVQRVMLVACDWWISIRLVH